MNNNDSSEDFWDLDDDDLDLELPSVSKEPLPEKVSPAKKDPSPVADLEPAPQPVPKREAPTIAQEIPSTKTSEVPEKPNRERKPFTLVEKISVLAVLLFLGAVAAWGLTLYYKHAPEGELIVFQTDFPVKGESVTVAEVETWWRSPVREGENADRGVQLSINLIPCARIKIQDTSEGLLWITFRNGEQDLAGDPINLVISGGKFEANGSDEIEVHSTSGFTDASKINSYTNGDIDPWSVVIVESQSGEDFSSNSDPLLKVRVDAAVPADLSQD